MKKLLLLLPFIVLSSATLAQLPVSLTLPQVSPLEDRSITIGLTKISFEYSSVGIKDREIWGGLIPYGEVWRTGANKNTVFTVSDDVLINGQALSAGSYGFHTIPGEEEWVIIFSNNSEAWGSYFYDQSEDALRITVPVSEMDSRYEWMKFSFSNYTATSVDIALKWAYRSVPFTVEVPMEVTFANISEQFTTRPAFTWQGWVQGATYTINNNYKMDVGLQWAERAMGMEKRVQTYGLAAKLYVLNNQKEKGMSLTNEMVENWGDDWRSHYSAAEVYETAEEIEMAKSAYEMAISLAENDRTKRILQQRIEELD
jgi:hypothetical protein